VFYFEVDSVQEARTLESEIKGRGAKRFLEDKKVIT